MIKQQKSYPVGVRALLVDETSRRRAIESRVVGALESAGFGEIVLPIIDFVDPYGQVFDAEAQKRSYRFTDREGELVSIRSDFTPMIARALAPVLAPSELPLRVFYRGDVIRCEATRLGINREFFQIGAEVIGEESIASDLAMLQLCAALVASCGIRPLIVYTDVRLASSLIDAATDDPDTRIALQAALANKRGAELTRLRPELEPAAAGLLQRLMIGAASLDDLRGHPATAGAADRLAALAATTATIEGADFLHGLDDIDEEPGYYTGLRFRIFAPSSRATLGQGGRYDDLYHRFGLNAAALGFTLTIDYLDAELTRAATKGTSS